MRKRKLIRIAIILSSLLLSMVFSAGCSAQFLIDIIDSEFTQNTTSSFPKETEEGEYQARDYEFVGSADELQGKVLVITILLNDSESYWTSQNEWAVKEKVGIASDYIEEMANNYGVSLEIISDEGDYPDLSYESEYDGYVEDFDTLDEYTTDPFQEALLDEISSDIPVQKLLNKYDADSVAFLGVVNKEGRSYAYPYETEYGQEYFNECCCLFFNDETYYEEEPPAVYAHELLHLFGAQDLYEGEDEAYNYFSDAQYDYIVNNYPNELMYTTYDENGYSVLESVSNEVTDITAYYLGWQDTLPEGFLEAASY